MRNPILTGEHNTHDDETIQFRDYGTQAACYRLIRAAEARYPGSRVVPYDDLMSAPEGTFAAPVIQALRPDGTPRLMTVPLPLDLLPAVDMMELTAEVLMSGEVVVYARWLGYEEDEGELGWTLRLATNGPGPDSPDKAMEACIRDLLARLP